ncbi:MAG: imidazoleglycerol-phosphate dehydratase HisB [Propionibacteriaceae bacterium]|jgi:imidazoleglycerol-phosphate dehydratase|nr:imidazoleglycerol-phosphate dehydratase HisB [Propionibacteriaceae bacterium]
MTRTATVERTTSESSIKLSIDLDGNGESTISTGVGFYDHMLTALSKHSLIDMSIEATGDVHVDGHHVVEDTAIGLGQALKSALGDKYGIARFGDAIVPLDEALAQCVVDISGRAYAQCLGEPEAQTYARIGGSGVPYVGSMTHHVVEALAANAMMCIHLTVLSGRDPHHIAEAQYKALARALRAAIAPDHRLSGIPSTKGTL